MCKINKIIIFVHQTRSNTLGSSNRWKKYKNLMTRMFRHRKLFIYSRNWLIKGRLKNRLKLREIGRRVQFYENIEYSNVTPFYELRMNCNKCLSPNTSKPWTPSVKNSSDNKIQTWASCCSWTRNKRLPFFRLRMRSISRSWSMRDTGSPRPRRLLSLVTSSRSSTSIVMAQPKRLPHRRLRRSRIIMEYILVIELLGGRN